MIKNQFFCFQSPKRFCLLFASLWIAVAIFSPTLSAQSGWEEVEYEPSARGRHAMAYFPKNKTVVLFGGWDGSKRFNDTWVWYGLVRRWVKKNPASSPPYRNDHAMAYDDRRKKLFLFGGYTYTGRSRETWAWDGTNWTKLDKYGPYQSAGVAIAPHRGRLYLFGGEGSTGYSKSTYNWAPGVEGWSHLSTPRNPSARAWHAMVPYNDTFFLFGGKESIGASNESWQFYNGDWYSVPFIGPGARYCHAMTLDEERNVVVVHGGNNGFNLLGDTWEWTGFNWTKRSNIGPSARYYHAMAYDNESKRSILFGGYTTSGYSNETWMWSGSYWARREGFGLDERRGHALAYDSYYKKVILFGGFSSNSPYGFNDTWEWNGEYWINKTPSSVSPSKRCRHAMAYDDERKETVLFGGFRMGWSQTLSDTWVWNNTVWTQKSPANAPQARESHAIAYDRERKEVVLFGGYRSDIKFLGDTWVWDGTNWTQRFPTNSPPARRLHAMAYDAARKRVVLFGGWGDPGFFSDTWEWTGTNWIKRAANGPSGRYLHSMAFAENTGNIVLFGGVTSSVYSSETWEYDNGDWRRTSTTGPFERGSSAMVYDASNEKVVLFGGFSSQDFNDTWLYSSIILNFPDLKVRFVKATSSSFRISDLIKLVTRIKNKKNAPSAGFTMEFYLSTNKTLDANDTLIVTSMMPGIGGRSSKRYKALAMIPTSITPGLYYIIAKIVEVDLNPINNIKAGTSPITIN